MSAQPTSPPRCPKCNGDVIPGKPFCPDCGALLAIGAPGVAIDAYIRDRIQKQLDSGFKDRRLVELETTEAVVNHLITWAKAFAFAVGIPAALCALVLGILGYRSIQDARKLTSEAAEKIRPVIEDALSKAHQAQQQSADSLARVVQLRESLRIAEAAVEKQRAAAVREADQVNVQLAQVSGMRNEFAELAKQLQERTTEAARLQKAVNDLSRRVETSEVARVFPDLGSKPVATINGQALGPRTPSELRLNLQLSYRAERDTRLTASQISDMRLALQKDGAVVFLGSPGVTRNRGTQLLNKPGGSEERTQVLYFRHDRAAAAQKIRKVIERWVPVQDGMVRFADPAKLDETTQEFLRLSDLDFLVVIGTR